MNNFIKFEGNYPDILNEKELKESDFHYVLELLEDIRFSNLFYLNCVEEEDNFELFNFIEANGELLDEFDDLQLYLFDDKKVVLYNTFDVILIFCKESDSEEFSEVF